MDGASELRTSRRLAVWAATVVFVFGSGCKVERIPGGLVDAADALDAAELEADTLEADDTLDAEAPQDALDALDALDADEETRPPTPCPWIDFGEGLRGGAVSWMGFDPRVPDNAFAVAGGLLSRTVDGGATWQRWSEREAGFGQLAFPSDDPKLILATSGDGVLASTDGGLTFAVRSLQGFGVRSIFIPPTAPQRVFVGTRGAGVLRSEDHGTTWTALNVGVPLAEVRALAGPQDNPDVLVAGLILLNPSLGFSGHGQLLHTVNGGASWTVALDGVGWGNHVVFCDDQTAFAAVRRGVFRSDDAGATWTPLEGFGTRDVLHLAVTPTCETVVGLVYQEGFYRSFDGGVTVEGPLTDGFALDPERLSTNALALDPGDPETLLAATYAGLFRSTDLALSWQVLDAGNGVAIRAITSAPPGGARLFASTWGSGVWTRGDGADPWTRVAIDLLPRDFVIDSFAVADRLFVSTIREVWVTDDGGETYRPTGLVNRNVNDLLALDGGDLLAASQTGGVLRSDDGGETWTSSNDGLAPFPTTAGEFIDARRLVQAPSGTLFLGTNGGGLFASDDAGASWSRVGDGAGIAQVVALAQQATPPVALYVLDPNRGVIRSDDGGATWSQGSTGLASLDISALAVDDPTGDVYVATLRDGVFRSRDRAESWTPLDRFCLPVRGFNALALVEDEEGRWLVGATSSGEVHRNLIEAAAPERR